MSAVPEITPRLYTVADLEELSAEGKHYELYFGELREMPPPDGKHGVHGQRLGGRLTVFVDDNGLGETFLAESGFRLTRDPDTVLAPDWSFIATARVPDLNQHGYPEVTPDIVLEVRSPSESSPAFLAKLRLWVELGVKLAWGLDPDSRTLTVYRATGTPQVLLETDELSGEDVLPGFTLPLSRVFR